MTTQHAAPSPARTRSTPAITLASVITRHIALDIWMTFAASFFATQAGSTLRRLGLGIPVEPIRVWSSSSCTARGADLLR